MDGAGRRHVESGEIDRRDLTDNIQPVVYIKYLEEEYHKAIFADNTEMASFLIQNGALINDMSCHYAAAMRRRKIIKILVEYGVNINVRDGSGRTPLHWACQEGYTDIVDLLVENGAQMNVQDEDGQTPLYIASAEGHYNVVKQLLEKGKELY